MLHLLFSTIAAETRELTGALRRIRPESWVLAGIVLAAIILWTALAARLPTSVLPSPLETAEAFFRMLADPRRDYLRAIMASARVFLAGLALAAVLGFALAFLVGLLPLLGRVLAPLLDLLGSVPHIAFMPLVVALMGLGDAAKVTIVLISALLPVTVSGVAALRQVDPAYEETARDLGEGRLAAQLRVVWPLALPQVAAALRVGAMQGLIACVVAEIYSAMTGLGGLLVGYGNAFNMPRYLVVVLSLATIGVLVTSLLRRAERALARRAGQSLP